MQIGPINQNSNNCTFGAIISKPEVLTSRVKQLDRAIKLIYQQDKNKAADIIIADGLTKVVAKKGYMLSCLSPNYDTIKCKSLTVNSVNCRDWEHAVANCTDENNNNYDVKIGVLSTSYLTGDENIDAAERIACCSHDAYSSQYEGLNIYYGDNDNALRFAIDKLLSMNSYNTQN